MSNPWEEIELSDYENHMSLNSVYQLQVLSEMMKEQFYTYDIKTMMILGIAGGNGLEHIHKNNIEKVYGVDINQKYLDECGKRYSYLDNVLVTICVDLLSVELQQQQGQQQRQQLPHAELVIANLLIEYIGYECFGKVVKVVNPQYVSCIIQINVDDSFVSDSPYLHVFDGLDEVHHQMEDDVLIESMQKIGYEKVKVEERMLPNGKKFVRVDFKN